MIQTTDEEAIFPPIGLKAELVSLNKKLKKHYIFGTDGHYFLLDSENGDKEFTGYLTEAQMYKTLQTINKLLAFDNDEKEEIET